MFFFNDTATTEIYTLSLHDALPIFGGVVEQRFQFAEGILNIVQHLFYTGSGICFDTAYSCRNRTFGNDFQHPDASRSEEHTSELQSRQYLVCRLLLEKKKQQD